jgi:hypothetical protein
MATNRESTGAAGAEYSGGNRFQDSTDEALCSARGGS